MKNVNLLLILLLLITFLKNIIWSIATPIWAGPDEPAHFGYAQYVNKTQKFPELHKSFISKEIIESTNLLEINKINFHSNVIFSFAKGKNSLAETKIRNFPDTFSNIFTSWAPVGVHPPLYYIFLSSFINFLPHLDLFDKVYILRLISIFLSIATIFIAFKITKKIFKNNTLLTITIPLLISFQPMMTFINGVINNDNLLIFLYSIFLYIVVLFIYKKRLNIFNTLCLSIIAAFCLLSKQQSIALVIPFVTTYIVYAKIKNKLRIIIPHLIIFLSVIIILNGWYYWKIVFQNMAIAVLDPYDSSKLNTVYINIFQYFFSFSRFKTIFNYYWGTFGWLDTTLPFFMHALYLILTLLSFFGIIFKVYKSKLNFYYNNYNFTLLIFAISVVSFFSIIFALDFIAVNKTGKNWIQGRYLLPVIIPTMLIFFLGIKELLKTKIAIILTTSIIIGSNLYSLFFSLIPRYYGSDINLWVQRISQNKPVLLKGNILLFLMGLYLICLIFFLILFFSKVIVSKEK
ncbi:MAG: DUF2142 domain-containing protein [Candidatus Levybacteria bacterium]|nr:DUF2142 domain-containing protein [Candidatus Levybacteria bacterium]